MKINVSAPIKSAYFNSYGTSGVIRSFGVAKGVSSELLSSPRRLTFFDKQFCE